jgi:2-oxo-3-hexenedioate decarboxylase
MTVESIAQDIAITLQRRQLLQPLAGRVPGFDVATAYDVARQLRRQRLAGGRQVLGRKIGFTNRSIWPVYGVFQPIWGAMYDDTVHTLPAGSGSLSLRGLYEPRIEPEIVLHLASAPQPGEGPARLLARVDRVAHGFEIVQSPFPGWRFGTADAVAVGSLHAALCLGPAVDTAALAADPLAALCGFAITLSCDGVDRDQGRGANVLDGPLHALQHLVQVLADRPADEQLQAGEWISTGTLTAALPVAAGQRWQTRLEGIALPGLDLRFEA